MNRKKIEFLELILMSISAASVVMTIFAVLFEDKTFPSNETFITVVIAFFCTITCAYMVMFFRRISPKKNIFVLCSIEDREDSKTYSDMLLSFLMRAKRYRFELVDAEKAVSYGENIKDALTNAIEKSDIVLLYISNSFCNSSFCSQELQTAKESQKVIIPILLEKVEDIEKFPNDLLEIKSVTLYRNLNDEQKKQEILELSKDLLTKRFV